MSMNSYFSHLKILESPNMATFDLPPILSDWVNMNPITNEQVFYDKFLYGKFYLPSARVYVRQILYDKFLVF